MNCEYCGRDFEEGQTSCTSDACPGIEDLERAAALALRELATRTGAMFQVRAYDYSPTPDHVANGMLVMEVFPLRDDTIRERLRSAAEEIEHNPPNF